MLTGTGFWIGFTAVLFLCMLNTILIAVSNLGLDVTLTTDAPKAFILFGTGGTWVKDVLTYIYIFVLLLPFCFSYVKESKQNMVHCLQMRMGVRKYHYGNLFCSFLGSFLIFFVPFVIEIGINQIVFRTENVHGFTYNYMASISGDAWYENLYSRALPFKWLYINHAQLYNVLYAFFFAAMAGIMGMFVYAISYYVRQYAIVLVLPLFVLLQIQSKAAAVSEELFGKDVQLVISEYITVDGMRGLCVWYIIGLVIVLAGCAILIIEKQCRRDQLG